MKISNVLYLNKYQKFRHNNVYKYCHFIHLIKELQYQDEINLLCNPDVTDEEALYAYANIKKQSDYIYELSIFEGLNDVDLEDILIEKDMSNNKVKERLIFDDVQNAFLYFYEALDEETKANYLGVIENFHFSQLDRLFFEMKSNELCVF